MKLFLVSIVIFFCCFLGGCSPADFVKTSVPKDIQVQTGVKPVVTLNEAKDALDQYVESVQANIRAFTNNIARADEKVKMIQAFATLGLDTLNQSGAMSGIPILAGLSGAVFGFLGLMTPKPGSRAQTEKEVAQARDAGYDLGRKETLELLSKKPAELLAENAANTPHEG